MKLTRYISLIIALLSVLGMAAQQQQNQYALYNYRNDGDFNAWLNIDVDSITYSYIGIDSVEYDNIVTQEVWTPDSCYRIPLEAIDSIGFRAPEPEFKEGIFHITEEHLPYAIGADSLSVTFDSSIPTSMLPAIGQIVISDVYDDPFEDGFAGRVESVDFLEGKYVIQCSEVKITDIFSKLVLVGKGVSVSDEQESDARRKTWSWWEDPAFTVEGQGIFPVKLPKELTLTLLSDVCTVKSKNPEMTVSYFLYLDDVIYSFSVDAYLNHKDLSFQIAFKLSDFLKIGNSVSENLTNYILGKGDEEETEEKWYEYEYDDIKLEIPFHAGPVNFAVELAPIFKLDGDVEIDVINKTSARQHIGFKSSGYTATLFANPFLSLALSDLNYNYVQDPIHAQQLTMKAEGSATMGISLQLKANVVSKKLLHASVGAEYNRKASAKLQFNLYDTENPISGLYDVIKDSKVKVEDYVKIKGEIGVSPLKVLTLKGSFKIPIKEWGEYYMVPHFSKPKLPPYKGNPYNFSKPLSMYSTVSKDILLGCKPGLRIEDSNGMYVKQYTSTNEYQYEAAWAHTPLEIDISDLTPNKTYRCYPTFSMLGMDPFVVTPYNEFTIPENLSASPQSLSMPVGMSYAIEIIGGWDTFATVMEEGEDVASIVQDGDPRHVTILGKKEGTASLKIEDRRSGQVVHVPITVTGEATHEYVDLGLPSGTLWATCNVGANSPEEYGDYFAWGEVTPKENYSWKTYKYCDGSNKTLTKYCTNSSYGYNDFTDGLTELLTQDDAATANWGSDWQMPTLEQMEELYNNCTQVWTTQNDVDGILVTGPNGNSIFLPAAGDFPSDYLYGAGKYGWYWSSSLSTSKDESAYELVFDRTGWLCGGASLFRSTGITVRPVRVQNSQYVTNILLSQTTVNMQPSGTVTLTATVLPEDADNKTLAWESSNEGVAMVSTSGIVTAIGEGSCVITCSAVDGSGVKAECQVTVSSGTVPDPEPHEYVDLGLPSGTLWATCNVGANSPEEYGDYFAWGETAPKDYDDWSTYKWCNGSYVTMTKYCILSGYGYNGFTDGKTELDPEDDAATANWGSGWQMPSLDQIKELYDSKYTTTEWTTQGGVEGRRITSKSNGNSIFLPAAGYRWRDGLLYAGSYGYYWSSSLNTNYDYYADGLLFDSGGWNWSCGLNRGYGQSVRAVRP